MGCARAIEALLGRRSEAASSVPASSGYGEGAGKQVFYRRSDWPIIPGVVGPHMLIGSIEPLGSGAHRWLVSVRLLSRHHRPDHYEWLSCLPGPCASASHVGQAPSTQPEASATRTPRNPMRLDRTDRNEPEPEGGLADTDGTPRHRTTRRTTDSYWERKSAVDHSRHSRE